MKSAFETFEVSPHTGPEDFSVWSPPRPPAPHSVPINQASGLVVRVVAKSFFHSLEQAGQGGELTHPSR